MKALTRISLSLLIIVFISSCVNKHEKALNTIKELETTIRNQVVVSPAEGQKLIQAYVAFADDFPEDTISPVFIYNGARLSMAINNPNQSLQMLDRLISEWPNHKLIPDAYILTAMIYETMLGDLDKAKEWYELFLKDFPGNPMSMDVRMSLEMMGKPMDDIVHGFIENQTDSTATDAK